MNKNDPIGEAIWDYYHNNNPLNIDVESDITDIDIMPIEYLFRNYSMFPELEKVAMKHCKGKILDVGAAAGPHALYLADQGFEVETIDISPKANAYLKEVLPNSIHHLGKIQDFSKNKYDTILLLMNGIGLAGTYDEITPFLAHLASLLEEGGCILAESTDVIDVFEDDDGGIWIDLNANYYGEFRFNMKYKDAESGWFNWTYLDRNSFSVLAEKAGLEVDFIFDNNDSFLVKLTKM